MKLIVENTVDAAREEEKHYIEWIEVIADGKAYRQFLKPGEAPEAVFNIEAGEVTTREYCSVHGLWKA
jgi:superoxide reductase